MDAGLPGGGGGKGSASVRPFRFDALHAEVLDLAEEARAYIASRPPPGGDAGDPLGQLVAAREATRLVSRVGFCLAWLLARRAAAAGEPEPADPEAGWRLGGREVCLAGPAAAGGPLPPALSALLERSVRLYRRIDRLDRQLAGEGLPAAAVASPTSGT